MVLGTVMNGGNTPAGGFIFNSTYLLKNMKKAIQNIVFSGVNITLLAVIPFFISACLRAVLIPGECTNALASRFFGGKLLRVR